ncbi:hypothetical protein GCM10029992_15330 [Glycomyces albus]
MDEDFTEQWERFDGGDCPVPDDQTSDQAGASNVYNQVLSAGLSDIGAAPLGRCAENGPDHDGFFGFSEPGAYYLQEWVRFPDSEPSRTRRGTWRG